MNLSNPQMLRSAVKIGQNWCAADDGAMLAVFNPATGEKVGDVPLCGAAETRRAIDAANDAWPAWRAQTARQRAQLLRAWFELIVANTDDGITSHLPKGEDWMYLKMAAVHPDHQGKGLGGRIIRTGLAEAARLGVPSVLETATPSNVGLYQRLGYCIASEWDVAKGGPHFWTMTNPEPAG